MRAALLLACASGAAAGAMQTLSVVGVGSCNHDYEEQAYWGTVGDALRGLASTSGGGVADAFIWLGDAIYGDDYIFPAEWRPTDLATIQQRYRTLRHDAHYAAFANTSVAITLGVWDDHDLGRNDADGGCPDKEAVKQTYLDFIGVHADDRERRSRDGLYSLTTLSFNEAAGGWWADQYEHAVCVVLLDVRYNQQAPTADGTADILGDAQWAWLDSVLRGPLSDEAQRQKNGKDACMLTLVGGGIQFVADTFPGFECWGNFPESRTRLFRAMKSAGLQRAVLLSGDVHFAEVVKDTRAGAVEHLGYPVYDFTSSGLTHSCGEWGLERGDPEVECWFDALYRAPTRAAALFDRNFGSVELRADPTTPGVAEAVLRIHHLQEHGAAAATIPIRLSELAYPADGAPATPAGRYPHQPTPPFLDFIANTARPSLAAALGDAATPPPNALNFAFMYTVVVLCLLAAAIVLLSIFVGTLNWVM